MEQVKRCPSCGSDDITLRAKRRSNNLLRIDYGCECECCSVYGPRCPTQEQAIAEWNAATRNPPDPATQPQTPPPGSNPTDAGPMSIAVRPPSPDTAYKAVIARSDQLARKEGE